MEHALLTVENLSISFEQYGRGLKKCITTPIKDLNIEINKGEIVAIVGASGSGKSLLAHAIMDILPPNASVDGKVSYKNETLSKAKIKEYRGKQIAFIPQSVNYLDPLMKVKNQVKIGLSYAKREERYRKIYLNNIELKKTDGDLYPYQLSGGMLRRVLFATSIGKDTELIIADEPTPGIHQAVLDKVLRQLRAFADSGMGVILITHDIISAVKIADRISVFLDGMTVETAPSTSFSGNGEALKEAYSRKLWNSLPQNNFLEIT